MSYASTSPVVCHKDWLSLTLNLWVWLRVEKVFWTAPRWFSCCLFLLFSFLSYYFILSLNAQGLCSIAILYGYSHPLNWSNWIELTCLLLHNVLCPLSSEYVSYHSPFHHSHHNIANWQTRPLQTPPLARPPLRILPHNLPTNNNINQIR